MLVVRWTYESDSKRQRDNYAQCKSRLEHRASPVDVVIEVAAARRYARIEVAAVRTCYPAQSDDSADKGAEEEQVDEGDEEGIMFGEGVGDDGADDPGEGEAGHDEEDENVVGRELVGAAVVIDEPSLE